jgi:hypothetical protein
MFRFVSEMIGFPARLTLEKPCVSFAHSWLTEPYRLFVAAPQFEHRARIIVVKPQVELVQIGDRRSDA